MDVPPLRFARREGFGMMGTRVTHFVARGMVGICLALVCQCASAALLVEELLPPQTPGDGLLQSLFCEALVAGDMAAANTLPSPSEDEEDSHPAFRLSEGLLPAAGCQPTAVSHGGGNGWGGAALAVAPMYVPKISPGGTLPSEPKTILATGPPFKLLRPV